MRILKLTLIIIAILSFVLFCATILFVKTFDISSYEKKIVEGMSSSIGRVVEVGNMDLTFTFGDGLVFVMDDLKIADSPEFSQDYFLKVKSVILDVDLFALLSHRKILDCRLDIVSPSVSIIRNEDGLLNVQTLGGKTIDASTTQKENQGSKVKAVQIGGALSALLVKEAVLHDGTLFYLDKESYPEMSVEVAHVDLKINDFSLMDQFDFELKAAIAGDQQNISLTGLSRIYPRPLKVRLEGVQLLLELTESLFIPFKDLAPELGQITHASGSVQLNSDQIVFNSSGIKDLEFSGGMANGYLKMDKLMAPMTQISVDLQTSGQDLNITQYSLNLGKGRIRGDGRVLNYLTKQSFDIDTYVEGVQIEKVVDQKSFSAKVLGNIFTQLRLSGKIAEEEDLLYSLIGKGSFEVKEGKIADINVLKFILSKISMIPNLHEKIEANLSEKYKKILQEKDTDLNKVEFTTEVGQGEVAIKNLNIEADSFGISGIGALGFNQDLYLKTALFIPADLSRDIIKSAPELEPLLNQNGQIYIPLNPYRGNVKKVRLFPDLSYLGKKLIIDRGRQELRKIIDKALDINEEDNQVEDQNSEGQIPSEEKQRRPEEELIESVLDTIFN